MFLLRRLGIIAHHIPNMLIKLLNAISRLKASARTDDAQRCRHILNVNGNNQPFNQHLNMCTQGKNK